MKVLHMITFTLLAIGGLNWLLVGITGKDLFMMLHMGFRDALPMLVYLLVGVSAVFEIVTHKHNCKACNMNDMPKPTM